MGSSPGAAMTRSRSRRDLPRYGRPRQSTASRLCVPASRGVIRPSPRRASVPSIALRLCLPMAPRRGDRVVSGDMRNRRFQERRSLCPIVSGSRNADRPTAGQFCPNCRRARLQTGHSRGAPGSEFRGSAVLIRYDPWLLGDIRRDQIHRSASAKRSPDHGGGPHSHSVCLRSCVDDPSLSVRR